MPLSRAFRSALGCLLLSLPFLGNACAAQQQPSPQEASQASPQPVQAAGIAPTTQAASSAQQANSNITTPSPAPNRPLPDIPTLMHQVEADQRASELIEKDYLYRSVEAIQELDSHGNVKKTETDQYDVFWINGVPVRRLLKKNGKDLSESEKKQEDERIDKESAKARERRDKAAAQGKETDPRGEEVVTVSRLLELGSFSDAHRVQLHGRDTIVVNYTGDPNAKTRNSFENVIRDLVGTIWVDEQDHAITRLEGHFVNNFKVGGGLLVNIQKGLTFSMEQVRINDEVWLPEHIEGHGSARALLLFHFNGHMVVENSNYRKFKTDSTIVSAGSAVPAEPAKSLDAPQ
jgi:hypothetical protein